MCTDVRTIRVWDSKIGKVEDVRIDAAGECFGEHVRVQIAEDVANAIEEDYLGNFQKLPLRFRIFSL